MAVVRADACYRHLISSDPRFQLSSGDPNT